MHIGDILSRQTGLPGTLFVVCVLVAAGIAGSSAMAGEINGDSPDLLQPGMSSHQTSFDQRMAVRTEDLLYRNTHPVGIMLEEIAHQRLGEIRIAVEKSPVQQQEYVEEINVYPPPVELEGDSRVCIAGNEAAEC